jgi:protein Hikeshi
LCVRKKFEIFHFFRKIENLVDMKIAYEDKIKLDINQEFAKRVAKNLFNYLDSFNQNQDPSKKFLVVPLNTIEQWYDKFLQKYKLDPNFLMKTDL